MPVTLPLFKGVIIYDDGRPFKAKLMSNPGREPPSYDMIAVTKSSIAEKFPVPSLGINLGSPKYKTNALTTEPKSRFSDPVVRD